MEDKKTFVNAPQVQSTNDASIVSKCSMANSSYIKDDFVKYFVQKEKSRASLIHLGYYTRCVIISGIITQFIKFLQQKKMLKFQIISCGAGFDTTYWRLAEDKLLNEKTIYIEIDYPDVINRKFTLIKESCKLQERLIIPENDEITQVKKLNDNYYLIGADLCDAKTIESVLERINIDFDDPTLFLSECAITYMKTDDSDKLLKWMTEKFENCGFVNYEQIHPEDGFGCVMLRHFKKLQSPLHSVLTYPDCNSHRRRYRSLGFESSVVGSEWDFFLHFTVLEERMRVLTLEQFDEFEELHLKCAHYVVGVSGNKILRGFLSEMELSRGDTREDLGSSRVDDKGEGLELFGHCTCETREGVLIFGGFGSGGRSRKVSVLRNGKIEAVSVSGGEEVRLDAMHGSAVSFEINGKAYIGLYGGRTSPNSVINNGDFIVLEYSRDGVNMAAVLSCERGPAPRYRCSVVSQPDTANVQRPNGVSVWIFGGRTADLKETLSGLWQLTIQENGGQFKFNWVKKERESEPCPRMAHSSAVSSVNDAMYVTGGLDTQNFSVLNDIWKWSFGTESWHKIKPKIGCLIPRYGHTSHIRGNVLYMVGGVSASAGFQPGVSFLDLDALRVSEYLIEPFRTEPVLLFNHGSVIVGDDNDSGDIVVLGGGGNCFSFGTYFNKGIYSIPLKQFSMR